MRTLHALPWEDIVMAAVFVALVLVLLLAPSPLRDWLADSVAIGSPRWW